MIKEQVYKDTANAYGCTIGLADLYTGAAAEARPTGDEMTNRCILQSIDMGQYQALQRQLANRSRWGRKSESTIYKEIIKGLRNAEAKRRTL